jgi:hypothetical protein
MKLIKEPSRQMLWQDGITIEKGKRIYNDDVIKIDSRLYESLDAYFREALDYPQNLFGSDDEVYLISEDQDGDITIWLRDKYCRECTSDKVLEHTMITGDNTGCTCNKEWPISFDLVNVVWLV